MAGEADNAVVFFGTPDFAAYQLRFLVDNGIDVVAVVTAPDRAAGRGQKVKASAVKEVAIDLGLKVLQPTNLKDESFVNELSEINPALQVVVAFRMLPKVVWEIPEKGTINLHASLLPQYRGAAPINWAIINGEKKTGVSTFLIDDKIDTGDILMKNEVLIEKDENFGDLHDKLKVEGAKTLLSTCRGLLEGTLTARPQSSDGPLKAAPKIFKDDCRIDWNLGKTKLLNFVRGMSPYPAAFSTMTNGDDSFKVKVFEMREGDGDLGKALGEIVILDQRMLVQIGGDSVEIVQIQREGKSKMLAKSFILGLNQSKTWFFE